MTNADYYVNVYRDGRTVDEGDCYWVKFSPNDDWQVAEWNKVYGWFWIGCESAQRVAFAIGPRIMPPNL